MLSVTVIFVDDCCLCTDGNGDSYLNHHGGLSATYIRRALIHDITDQSQSVREYCEDGFFSYLALRIDITVPPGIFTDAPSYSAK